MRNVEVEERGLLQVGIVREAARKLQQAIGKRGLLLLLQRGSGAKRAGQASGNTLHVVSTISGP